MALKTYLIQGSAKWCKILGDAPPGYDNGPNEWSVDVVLDEKGKKDYLASGGDAFYIKSNKDGQEFIKFTRKAVKADGEAAKSIRVVDHRGEEWDQTKLIGNDSTINVSFSLNEVKSKGTKRLKPSILAIQVWDWKPYKVKSEFPVKEDTNIATSTPPSEDWAEEASA